MGVLPFAWGYFEFCFFGGEMGHIFSIFLYFFREVQYVFVQFCKDTIVITLAITARSRVQNHWVAPSSTQPFILPRSIKWVPGISGNLVVKSKLPPRGGTSLEPVEPHSQKGTIKIYFFIFAGGNGQKWVW